MTEPGSSKVRLAELDALRGIAALGVVLFHYTVKAPEVLPGVVTVDYGLPVGNYGVQLFFAISGFVIFMTLERTKSSADFAFARFTRLFPAYWAAILLTTGALHLLGATDLTKSSSVVATNFTMLQGFLYVEAVDGVYWSLTVELAFYLCMWALWRAGALHRIEPILCLWIAMRFAWILFPQLPSLGAKLLLVDHIAFFAIGVAAYRVRMGFRRWRDQIPVLLSGLIAVAMADGAEMALIYCGTTAIFFALVAERLAFLDRPVLLWLGALSYPLYLVHQNIGYAFIAALEAAGVPAWTALIAAFALALGLAQMIHDFVETPSLRVLRNLWKARRNPRPA
ncbi:MAG: acyltransferase [Novosphingobium sp.]|nr:acyltransferase [Novosphingobium sp.]